MNLYDLQDNDREVIEKILRKEKFELTKEDIIILKARKSYIRSDEWERLMGEDKPVIVENNEIEQKPVENLEVTPVEKIFKIKQRKVKRNKRKAANSK